MLHALSPIAYFLCALHPKMRGIRLYTRCSARVWLCTRGWQHTIQSKHCAPQKSQKKLWKTSLQYSKAVPRNIAQVRGKTPLVFVMITSFGQRFPSQNICMKVTGESVGILQYFQLILRYPRQWQWQAMHELAITTHKNK